VKQGGLVLGTSRKMGSRQSAVTYFLRSYCIGNSGCFVDSSLFSGCLRNVSWMTFFPFVLGSIDMMYETEITGGPF
jgi:hypothetical protein